MLPLELVHIREHSLQLEVFSHSWCFSIVLCQEDFILGAASAFLLGERSVPLSSQGCSHERSSLRIKGFASFNNRCVISSLVITNVQTLTGKTITLSSGLVLSSVKSLQGEN